MNIEKLLFTCVLTNIHVFQQMAKSNRCVSKQKFYFIFYVIILISIACFSFAYVDFKKTVIFPQYIVFHLKNREL